MSLLGWAGYMHVKHYNLLFCTQNTFVRCLKHIEGSVKFQGLRACGTQPMCVLLSTLMELDRFKGYALAVYSQWCECMLPYNIEGSCIVSKAMRLTVPSLCVLYARCIIIIWEGV